MVGGADGATDGLAIRGGPVAVLGFAVGPAGVAKGPGVGVTVAASVGAIVELAI